MYCPCTDTSGHVGTALDFRCGLPDRKSWQRLNIKRKLSCHSFTVRQAIAVSSVLVDISVVIRKEGRGCIEGTEEGWIKKHCTVWIYSWRHLISLKVSVWPWDWGAMISHSWKQTSTLLMSRSSDGTQLLSFPQWGIFQTNAAHPPKRIQPKCLQENWTHLISNADDAKLSAAPTWCCSTLKAWKSPLEHHNSLTNTQARNWASRLHPH